jgi:hypothetical protein
MLSLKELEIRDGIETLADFKIWLQDTGVGLAIHEAMIPDFALRQRQTSGRIARTQSRSRQLAALELGNE